ncbi:hypothetical protein ACK8OR_00635 [Jannaschia sp. KMU-145]|uniref:hypothetical protein n=1 Tax=Jannaschia halovivens TaxID=3388667 RepID=UPI00396B34BA
MQDGWPIFLGTVAVSAVILFGLSAGWFEGLSARALSDWLRGLDARIWQAVIAGFFVAAGWLVNGWQNRRVAAKLRAERLRDAHRAIFAEIDANLSNLLEEGALRRAGARMVRRMRADAAFVPLIPREKHDRIFSALEAEIHILPRVTIDPIVAYYSQLGSLAAHVEDMRDRRFTLLSTRRKIAMYLDYLYMKIAALRLGRKAVWLIEVYARDGKDAAEAEVRRLNVSSLRDGARSVP